MDYFETVTRINTLSNVTDAEQIATAINALADEGERVSAREAFHRAVLFKALEGHPNTQALAAYALKVR
jgi:hypothetical protein